MGLFADLPGGDRVKVERGQVIYLEREPNRAGRRVWSIVPSAEMCGF